MKHTIILLSYLLISSLLVGQEVNLNSHNVQNTLQNHKTKAIHEHRLDGTLTNHKYHDTGELGNSVKNVYSFDDDENILSSAVYIWYEDDWFLLYSYVYTYDTNGDLITYSYNWYDYLSEGRIGENIEQKYTYNAVGNVTSYENYWFPIYHAYEMWYKTTYEYDSDGELVLCTELLTKDEEIDDWYFINKVEYEYNDNDYVSVETHLDWEESTNTWVFEKRFEYTYDNSGNRLSEIWSHWDEGLNQWIYFIKEESEYNSNGILITFTESRWNEDREWQYWYKTEYTFDVNGNQTLLLNNEWDIESSEWEYDYKDEYSYDDSGNLILYIYSRWAFGSQWIYNSKEEFTYDSNGYILSHIDYAWGWYGGGDEWVARWKKEYIFDNVGNIILYEEYHMELPDLIWVNFLKMEYEYDMETFIDDVLYQQNAFESVYNYNYDLVNVPIKYKEYTDDNGTWELRNEKSFYYSHPFLNIPDDDVIVYPNPASDFFLFAAKYPMDIKTIELYDLNGKEALRQNGPNNRIDVSHLSSGVYLYKIYSSDEVFSGKVVVRN